MNQNMLTALVLTKNEEKNIEGCLKNISKITDEIVIIDSFSTDNTTNIASKYTKKIFYKKFENDYSKQRNYGLTKTSGTWVLVMDADERLSMRLINIIPKLLKTNKYNGYLIPRRNYINKTLWLKHGLFYPDYQLKLFKKKGVKYKNKIHEYPLIDEIKVKKIPQYIIHLPSETKYDKFSSIKRLFDNKHKHIQIMALEIINKRESLIINLISSIFLFIKYFVNSFIIGKGYRDKWPGFRAAVIFASEPLISALYALLLRYNRENKFKIHEKQPNTN